MNKEVSIKKVVLSIGKKEIELTVEEARQLKDSLDQVFGEKVIKETVIERRVDWQWIWPQPIYTPLVPTNPLYPDPPYRTTQIWCGTDTNSLNIQI